MDPFSVMFSSLSASAWTFKVQSAGTHGMAAPLIDDQNAGAVTLGSTIQLFSKAALMCKKVPLLGALYCVFPHESQSDFCLIWDASAENAICKIA